MSRTEALAAASEIKQTAFSPADVMALFGAFQKQAADTLLFLKYITQFHITHRGFLIGRSVLRAKCRQPRHFRAAAVRIHHPQLKLHNSNPCYCATESYNVGTGISVQLPQSQISNPTRLIHMKPCCRYVRTLSVYSSDGSSEEPRLLFRFRLTVPQVCSTLHADQDGCMTFLLAWRMPPWPVAGVQSSAASAAADRHRAGSEKGRA